MAQATVASMFGPKKALLARGRDSVFMSSKYMRDVQNFVLKYGAISITSLFIGSVLQAFDSIVFPLACILLCLFSYGFYLLYMNAWMSYQGQRGTTSTNCYILHS